jgi:hypothetical protein
VEAANARARVHESNPRSSSGKARRSSKIVE